jgi:hypothetical protein
MFGRKHAIIAVVIALLLLAGLAFGVCKCVRDLSSHAGPLAAGGGQSGATSGGPPTAPQPPQRPNNGSSNPGC